jgi:hypothetical protein
MCWELLTGRRYYGARATACGVIDALEGRAELPSEGALAPDAEAALRAPRLRASILAMLSRDAAQRPAVSDVLAVLGSFFE